MAQAIVSYYHQTYFGTSKLIVELAFTKGSSGTTKTSNENNVYRPWSKYSIGSSKYDLIHNKKNANDDEEEGDNSNNDNVDNDDTKLKRKNEKIDRKKEEFLQVMLGSKKANKIWDNDDGGAVGGHDSKNQDIVEDDSSSPSSNDEEDDEEDDDNYKGNNNGGHTETITTSDNQTTSEEFSPDRLFVRNLPFAATEEEVKEIFMAYGTIIECHIPIDDTNRNKGYAFIKFTTSTSATNARTQLDGSSFQGRLIHVLPARPERDNVTTLTNDADIEEDGVGSLTHKKKMELARQKEASHTTNSWSTNFIRGDAVVDNIADRFGMEKGAVLDVKGGLSSGNAAVRLALGETHVLEENRDFFRKHGIDMDAMDAALATKTSSSAKSSKAELATKKRSSTMILVKNLPYDTTHDELAKLFLSFCDDATILLSPSHTIALVEFKNANDAKKTFRKLAYKRFKHVPLYLEWAPLCKKDPSNSDSTNTHSGGDNRNAANPGEENEEDNIEEEIDGNKPSVSIYVKNLNFSTTENDVKNAFEEIIGSKNIRAVRIPTKAPPVKSKQKDHLQQSKNVKTQQLSMGYGFVECATIDSAKKAIKLLQGKVLHGHAMELKVSSKSNGSNTLQSERSTAKISKKKSTKLMVRNVPFQASRTDILQLFGSFGQLKTVRLPKKFDGGHRGFAFVEFAAAKEAQNAMKSLSQTHLYGRHLVLEWADDKEDVESIRTKVKRDTGLISSEGNGKNKKIRFS